MPKQLINIKELRELISKGDATCPVAFLESLMSGVDPRENSELANLVEFLDGMSEDGIDQDEWCEVKDLILSSYQYKPVPLNTSTNAAKTLAEYLHPKRKQVDVNSNEQKSSSAEPLTEEEISLFKEKFNDEFG